MIYELMRKDKSVMIGVDLCINIPHMAYTNRNNNHTYPKGELYEFLFQPLLSFHHRLLPV